LKLLELVAIAVFVKLNLVQFFGRDSVFEPLSEYLWREMLVFIICRTRCEHIVLLQERDYITRLWRKRNFLYFLVWKALLRPRGLKLVEINSSLGRRTKPRRNGRRYNTTSHMLLKRHLGGQRLNSQPFLYADVLVVHLRFSLDASVCFEGCGSFSSSVHVLHCNIVNNKTD
jgi:hypothetical protein